MYSRGFEVYIRCDGKPLEEYDVGEYDEDGEPTLECHIASEAGKRFTICWCEDQAETDMIVECYVDGQLVNRMAHFADVGKDESQGVIISQEKYRPYMFEEVRKTDDPKIAAPGSLDSLFGTIVVMLTAVEYWRPASKYTPFSLETVEDPRPIHSKDAVEGGHGVCFGRPESLPRSGCRPGKFGQVPVGSDEMEPFLCFCFIYMPKEILQTKGLIPKHSPKDSRRARTEDNDSVIDLSDETDDDRRVQSSAREGEAATLQAQLEAEVRKIQAQVNQLRRHLEMKKTLLAKLTKPYTPACSSRGKPKAIDLP